MRERRERRRGRLRRVLCVVVQCPRRVRAVRAPWTQVQHSVRQVRAGVRPAQLSCVRGDARRRNLLDLFISSAPWPALRPRVVVVLPYPPPTVIPATSSPLPTHSYCLSIHGYSGVFTIHTPLSLWHLHPVPLPLFRARARSSNWVIFLFYFPWLLLWCYFRALLYLPFLRFLFSFLFLFLPFPLFQSLVYSVHLVRWCKSNSLGLYSRKRTFVWRNTFYDH